MIKGFAAGRVPMEELGEVLNFQLSRGQAVLAVTGGSMHPLLRERDLVRLAAAGRALRQGDVILYRRTDGRYVLHRVVKLFGKELVCCGDHQWQGERIERAQVAAVAEARCRNGRWQALSRGRLWLFGLLWTKTFPLRRPLLRLRRFAGRLRRRVRGFGKRKDDGA